MLKTEKPEKTDRQKKEEQISLIYGTTNQAKLTHMQKVLELLPIRIEGIDDYVNNLPAVDEEGKDPLANAVLKAKTYFSILRKPVFSCDSGLFIEGLEPTKQPGTHVRRVGNKSLTDEEMTGYYSSLAAFMGGQCIAGYRNAICLMISEEVMLTSMDQSLWGEEFIISSTPHPKREKGFPLDCLSIHIESGKYYYDMESFRSSSVAPGFQRFFSEALPVLKQYL